MKTITVKLNEKQLDIIRNALESYRDNLQYDDFDTMDDLHEAEYATDDVIVLLSEVQYD